MKSYDLGTKQKSYSCESISSSKGKTETVYPSLHIGSEYEEKSKIDIPSLNSMSIGQEGKAEIKFKLRTISKGKGNSYVLDITNIIFEYNQNKSERVKDIANVLKGEGK